MKKILLLLLTFCFVLSIVPIGFATEVTEETAAPTQPVRAPGQCGEDLRWKYEDGTLTVSGSGAMDDYEKDAPWAEYKGKIQKLVLSGVTYIGANAFRDYDALEQIDFGQHIREFGAAAFYGCDGLEMLELPESFKIFGEESLRSCKNLKQIHCQGKFPSFRLNCLWDCYLTIYYPAERPWSVELIQQLEEAFRGRIEFLASDGTDHYVPTEATEETEAVETTAPPVETTAPETEAPTEAVTEPPVETAAPVTESPETQAPTQPPAPDTEPTQPRQEEQEPGISVLKLALTGMAAAVVLSVVLILVLILRKGGKRGKYEV